VKKTQRKSSAKSGKQYTAKEKLKRNRNYFLKLNSQAKNTVNRAKNAV
jgi:hypothetical protein